MAAKAASPIKTGCLRPAREPLKFTRLALARQRLASEADNLEAGRCRPFENRRSIVKGTQNKQCGSPRTVK
jgi:hypothetical protein